VNSLPPNIQADVAAISSIDVVPAILDVVFLTTGMGFAAVARVTEDHWVTCAVLDKINFGLVPGSELKVETTICHEVRQLEKLVVIDHVAEDKDFANHHTPTMYGFQSYISVPITLKNGRFFGTLCAIDPSPAKLNNPQIIGMFKLYADLIALHLYSNDQLRLAEVRLIEEKKEGELREQFIAILGHDLRNPVSAIKGVAQLLQRRIFDEVKLARFADILQNSTSRIAGLIDNMMEFARARLGAGINLEKESIALDNTLKHVIDELQIIWPDRLIEANFDLKAPVYCDAKRIAQLFSNILSNSLQHGDVNDPAVVVAYSHESVFSLTVTNTGKQIPALKMKHMFEPFTRSETKEGSDGLGLGLFISSEIAKAHGGSLEAKSTEKETSFKFTLSQ
jgi:signal transduction histidine kinase